MPEDEIRAKHARQCEGTDAGVGDIYLVLAWNDHAMGEHTSTVLVSATTAEKLVARGCLRRPSTSATPRRRATHQSWWCRKSKRRATFSFRRSRLTPASS